MGKVAKSFGKSKAYHRKSFRSPKFGKVKSNSNRNGDFKEISTDFMDGEISETISPVASDMEEEDTIDEEDDSDYDSDESMEANHMAPTRPAINNIDGMMDKLGDISWPEQTDWIERLSVDVDIDVNIDVNDDLARELAFYTQALDGARQAFDKLQSLGLPFLRPNDYYAEMVKSDSHMQKVKGRLLGEKKRIEEVEERQKARQSKRIAKEVQANKMKERTKQKKDDIEAVKTWRKQRKRSGYPDVVDRELPFEEGVPKKGKVRPGVSPGDRSGGKETGSKNMKSREVRNSRYGFGGRKGMRKQNTSESYYTENDGVNEGGKRNYHGGFGFKEGGGKRKMDDGGGRRKMDHGGGRRKMDDGGGRKGNHHGSFKKGVGNKRRRG